VLSDEGDKMAEKGNFRPQDRRFSSAHGGKDDAIEEVECRRKGGRGSDGPRRPVGREKMARHVEIGHPLGVLMGDVQGSLTPSAVPRHPRGREQKKEVENHE